VWEISIEDDYGERYSLSPNPASEIVTVTVKNSVPTDDRTIDVTNDKNTIYSIRIFDYYGVLYYSATKSGTSFTLPVDNLTDGNYIIQISDGNKISNLKLVVKH